MGHFNTVDAMWRNAIHACVDGKKHESRNGCTYETIGWSGVLDHTNFNFVQSAVRCADPTYAAAEFIWYMSMSSDGTLIKAYAPSYERYLEDNGHAYGAYGARWQPQFTWLKSLLRNKPDTRQAVLTCWDFGGHTDLMYAAQGARRDLPCTLSLQFLIRDKALHLVATMRSNDVWLGMPYDVFCFTTLQNMLAADLGLVSGLYTHQVGSLHVYDKNFSRACDALCELHGPMQVPLAASSDDLSLISQLVEFEKAAREKDTLQRVLNPCSVGPSKSLMCSLLGLIIRKWSPSLQGIVDPHIHSSLLEPAIRVDLKNRK